MDSARTEPPYPRASLAIMVVIIIVLCIVALVCWIELGKTNTAHNFIVPVIEIPIEKDFSAIDDLPTNIVPVVVESIISNDSKMKVSKSVEGRINTLDRQEIITEKIKDDSILAAGEKKAISSSVDIVISEEDGSIILYNDVYKKIKDETFAQ